MKIYRGDHTEIADVFLRTGNSYEEEEIMGDHTVHVEFDALAPVEFKLGDYVTANGQRFVIRYSESVKKTERVRGFNYSVAFHAEMYGLQDALFFLYGQPERLKNHDFYNGTAAQWADIIVGNMNRNGSGWSVGSVIESEAINMSFRDKTCAEVLNDLAGELDTEYYIVGKTVSIGRREYRSNGLSLSQGDGGGLRDIEVSAVDDTPPVTVVFPYGSDTNITKEYGNDYLVLPGGQLSMERNVDRYGRIEKSVQFEHVFPKGEFHVSAKIDDCTLQASDIDFNLTDCLINGVDATVTFQGTSGLAGYDLAIVKGSWDGEKKQFKLKKNEEENALEVPGDIHFAVGDMFILTGLKMPQSYIAAAEFKLRDEAQKFLDENSDRRIQLQCRCDDIYFKRNGIFIACGQMVGIVDNRLGIDREIRCTAVRRYLENGGNGTRYEITLSDFLRGGGLKDAVSAVNHVQQEIERNVRPVREYTKRRWRDVLETMEMMFDPEGDYFTDVITPLAVHAAQLIVGTNSQQMAFTGVRFIPNYNGDPNDFGNTAGTLDHFTVNGDHTVRTWNIPAGRYALNNSNAYFVYAKCARTGASGVIYIGTDRIIVDSDADYYHFLIGVLNSPLDGARSWQPGFGYTEISGNQITTGIIKDYLSRIVIDLAKGEIAGKVTFSSGTSGYENIADKPDLSPYDEALNYVDNVLPDTIARLQDQIDGAVYSWFYHYDPALSNVPASDWATAADRERHLDDTFTNLDSGQSWRFTKDGSVYGWTLMADSAATKALVLAGQAQDTADGKRRVFTGTPYPPYDAGDLWAQGAGGDLMRCRNARKTGSYVASDWEKASKYTDDSAALAAIDAAVLNLNGYLDGAFSDGIISGAEAAGIGTYLNVLASEKGNVDAAYATLYGNPLLTGTAKSNLNYAKTAFNAAYTNLVNQINAAVADGKATAAEKARVDDYYTTYRSALSNYSTRYEEAHAAVVSSVNEGVSSGLAAAREDLATRLGYGSYSDMVTAAAEGKTVINGGYIRTSLIDAAAIVTSQLVAQRLTAAMIAALDITTSRLTVTSGAKIGNFSIENGWLKSTAAAGQDAGYIDMRNGDSRVAFGSDLIPAVSGGGLTLSALIHNRKKAAAGGVTCALELRSSGDTNSTKAIALNARGGVVIKGSTSFVEEIAPLNMSTSDSSGSTAGVLLYYRCFAFQSSVSGYAADIFLPSDSAIDDAFGYFETGYSAVDHAFITVKMLVTRFSSGYYHVKSPASSTPLIDRDGNTVSSIQLKKGNFAEFTYCNRAWYLSAKN